MFLEKRVYQGSSGKVYPLPFYDRISEQFVDHEWQSIRLENRYVRIVILPEIGGRIHIGQDLTNGYHFFYDQKVIKPALVGLAGPWISGGVEFNWPQHHRPATYMPADYDIEEHEDGSVTAWLSDHDPLSHMKGMHGICLHPDSSVIELKVRLYNRTELTQTFLWWANMAVRVHDQYQSFFPPDVCFVADHAKRAVSEYPECKDFYYGVDYRPGTRLDWFKNIPVPTSYMALGSKYDFFGGYDHQAGAGFVHIADHYIAPGKKQWSWGNSEFGHRWYRHLADDGEPYIELMAGVYTDNQPDFSFLTPGETKEFSQYWYPIQSIGPVQAANLKSAVSLNIDNNSVSVGMVSTSKIDNALIELCYKGDSLFECCTDLEPGIAFVKDIAKPENAQEVDFTFRAYDSTGEIVISYTPVIKPALVSKPVTATEPPVPEEIGSIDELYITGVHLDQYRHVTRKPEFYWREALKRDPSDSRCNNKLGSWHLRRGEFNLAIKHFDLSIQLATLRNPNPYDGEPFYNLGVTLRYLEDDDLAYANFYKAAWNMQWASASYHSLAEIELTKGNIQNAFSHIDRSLKCNSHNTKARNLKAILLRSLGKDALADKFLKETLCIDPLDWWAKYLTGHSLTCSTQTLIDIALDCKRCGRFDDAVKILTLDRFDPGTEPIVHYHLAHLYHKLGKEDLVQQYLDKAMQAPIDYCFPSRLDDVVVLQFGISRNPSDARACYYLGNLYYDKERHLDAIEMWERSIHIHFENSICWRNLGIAYYNITQNYQLALHAYEQAILINPDDARLLYERDQLWKRLKISPFDRLNEIEKHRTLVDRRDDLSIELCDLHNQTGSSEKALYILSQRNFQPWEGGEGLVLAQHMRTHLLLGIGMLRHGDSAGAIDEFQAAQDTPENLGEMPHPLANRSQIYFWKGEAYYVQGDMESAVQNWNMASCFKGDFQEMSVRSYSEMTYFQAMSLKRLGRKDEANALFTNLSCYADELQRLKAKIDYFATSLPTMLIFNEDLNIRQKATSILLSGLADLGLGNNSLGVDKLNQVLNMDPANAIAHDVLEFITILKDNC